MVELNVVNNDLVVSKISNDLRVRYYFFATIFISIQLLVLYVAYDYHSIFYGAFLFIFINYGNALKRPANWHPVVIKKNDDVVFVNNKQIKKEDLIFLSFHQTDECRTIRLEAKRNNIFIANEARIVSNCSCEDEAIEICRVIRDFIEPTLQICYVRLVKGKSKRSDFINENTSLSGDVVFEKRYFIE